MMGAGEFPSSLKEEVEFKIGSLDSYSREQEQLGKTKARREDEEEECLDPFSPHESMEEDVFGMAFCWLVTPCRDQEIGLIRGLVMVVGVFQRCHHAKR